MFSSNCIIASTLPTNLDKWEISNPEDSETTRSEFLAIRKAWKSLDPFFASRGYLLYQTLATSSALVPPSDMNTAGPPANADDRYARPVYNTDQDLCFSTGAYAVRIWPARDRHGHEVIIKVVADEYPSSELEILQFLDTKESRSDPRNHTIPIIEFLKFEKFTFVVMPRWCHSFWPDFGTVNQLMHFTQSFLEAFDFLHENHIVHADFLEQNTAMNVIYPDGRWFIRGLRDPQATRYALIDFGFSKKYPVDIPIDETEEDRDYNFGTRGIPEPRNPYNPFKVDIIGMGLILQRWVRHLEDIVPELGDFFDGMVTGDFEKRFTARQALLRFNEVYSSLSKFQLNHEVANRWWEGGQVQVKEDDIY
ncbi:hypothetical protein GALMADRAFT_84930 [Galerina marginata CBS 339.88]|uniref:Protein kinase domain-containing protein n=1 Tax=Galerina marginata (strain CBS 339.88) TaxID=685588 RepID=A0A067U300_GALM3|nr:hypothetical protein GALMADRAFT_84930 [Galerina marginata CBS 339.88]